MRAGANAPLFDQRHHLPVIRPSFCIGVQIVDCSALCKMVNILLGSGKRKRKNACSEETFLNEEADDVSGGRLVESLDGSRIHLHLVVMKQACNKTRPQDHKWIKHSQTLTSLLGR